MGAFGVATVVLAVTLNIMDKKQFYLLYEKKRRKGGRMRKKYMNICLILGLLCLVYGLIVAIAGSGGTKFLLYGLALQ